MNDPTGTDVASARASGSGSSVTSCQGSSSGGIAVLNSAWYTTLLGFPASSRPPNNHMPLAAGIAVVSASGCGSAISSRASQPVTWPSSTVPRNTVVVGAPDASLPPTTYG